MNRFMELALELAARGAGSVSPNPMVGAVIECDGEIIGQGWHQKYGEAHAEVNAIASVRDSSLLSRSTMYVTLEPCSHWGKTPPCADLIIAKQIPRVVVGTVDPYPQVSGGGIARMQAAGVDVAVGVMGDECRELNRRFFRSQTDSRPYIILKWAESSDGFIDVCRTSDTPPAWMTGAECKKLVHQWRAQEDAIMVGRRTVELDDPELTVREVHGRNPLRITLDKNLILSTLYKIFNDSSNTILLTSHDNHEAAVAKFSGNSCTSIESYSENALTQLINILNSRKIQSLFVEGGRELLQSFIDAGLWDEARVFKSPKSLSDLYPQLSCHDGVPAPVLRGNYSQRVTNIDGVLLFECKKDG